MTASLLFCLVAFGALFARVSHCQSVSLEDWQSGLSTFYSGIDGGHCSYGSVSTGSFPYGLIVAPNSLAYDDSAACGRCYEVQCLSATTAGCDGCYTDDATGENKVVTVQVTDECPSCEDSADQFDLSDTAFSVIADSTCGVINMQYRQVSCDIDQDIMIRNKDGVNAWWFAVYVENVANYGEIAKVEIKDSSSGAEWITGEATVYNAFVFTSSSGFTAPLSVRLTDGSGEELESADVVTDFEGENEFNFGKNFAVDSDTQGDDDQGEDDDDQGSDTQGSDTQGSDTQGTDTKDTTVSDDGDIIIQNKDGINKWWYAFYVHNVPDSVTVSKVEMKDSALNEWTEGATTTYGAYVWQSSNGGWVLPFTVRITSSDGSSVKKKKLITDIDEYSQFDMGKNFDVSASASARVVGDTDDESTGGASSSDSSSSSELKDEVSTLEWVLGVVIAMVLIGAIVGGVCFYRKRKQQKTQVAGQDGSYVALQETQA